MRWAQEFGYNPPTTGHQRNTVSGANQREGFIPVKYFLVFCLRWPGDGLGEGDSRDFEICSFQVARLALPLVEDGGFPEWGSFAVPRECDATTT
jgi:hypothetical protein